ncbi:hypothetical protein [Salipaludibacillus keqinensis]|nr:hypothetical protein [Salipaludibacillus keqinensis]
MKMNKAAVVAALLNRNIQSPPNFITISGSVFIEEITFTKTFKKENS